MAFATGTKVDPRLMQADLSGFTKAAEIQAQGMANLGKMIGGGIAKYAKKKEEKKEEKAAVDFATDWATNNPEMAEAIGFDVTDDEGFFSPADISKSAKDFYKTVGKDSFKTVIPTLLNLQVKSEAAASKAYADKLEELRDPLGFQRLQQVAASDPNLRIVTAEDGGTGGMYQLERKMPGAFSVQEGVRLPKFEPVQFDDPSAELFRGQPGSAFIFGNKGVQYQGASFPGRTIPRRPEAPVTESLNEFEGFSIQQ